MAAPIRSTFGTRLLTNFLTYQGIFWNSWPCTENFRGQGWSGCGLGINGKRAGAGTNAVKNSGYFLACNVAVMLKIETRPGCTRTKSCDASRETKKNKKVTSKQEQRLNFRVNFDFWFCNDDFCRKPEGNKTWSLSFFYDVKNGHFFSCPNSKGNILQKPPTFFFLR